MSRQFSNLSPGVRPRVRQAIQELRNWVDQPAGLVRYVSRNRSTTGDGKSWDTCYLTIKEAIDDVNARAVAATQPDIGRNNVIFVGEGWYAELPQTLTANDTTIISVAPGYGYNTVLYGVPVAGTFSGVAGGPALKITGSNNSIIGMGLYTSDPIYPCLRIGNNASNPDGEAVSTAYGTLIQDCSFVRDVQNGSRSGIQSYGADYTMIDHCLFSTSQDQYGVEILTNGVINPVNHTVQFCEFVGTEIGILNGPTAHNTKIMSNWFRDDSTDRDDTITTAVVNEGSATSTVCGDNYWAFTDANAVITNAAMMINNHQLAST